MWTKQMRLFGCAGLLATMLTSHTATAAQTPAGAGDKAPPAAAALSPALRPQFEADPCTSYAKALMARAEARRSANGQKSDQSSGPSDQDIQRLDQACKAHAAKIAENPGG